MITEATYLPPTTLPAFRGVGVPERSQRGVPGIVVDASTDSSVSSHRRSGVDVTIEVGGSQSRAARERNAANALRTTAAAREAKISASTIGTYTRGAILQPTGQFPRGLIVDIVI